MQIPDAHACYVVKVFAVVAVAVCEYLNSAVNVIYDNGYEEIIAYHVVAVATFFDVQLSNYTATPSNSSLNDTSSARARLHRFPNAGCRLPFSYA